MRRAVLSIVAMFTALASGSAEACRISVSPSLENIAKADVIVHARLASREIGPEICCVGVFNLGQVTEYFKLSILRTYKGEDRDTWDAVWLTGQRVQEKAAQAYDQTKLVLLKHLQLEGDFAHNLQIDPKDGDEFIAALYTPPFTDESGPGRLVYGDVRSKLNERGLANLMLEHCVEGDAYLFPFNTETETRVLTILGEKA